VKVFVPESRERPIRLRCNVHWWMEARVGAFEHPFAVVTSADGSYEIKGGPAGKVRVIAWHERAGYLSGARGEEIELQAGTNTKDFKVRAR
jgi:hypothetical protein